MSLVLKKAVFEQVSRQSRQKKDRAICGTLHVDGLKNTNSDKYASEKGSSAATPATRHLFSVPQQAKLFSRTKHTAVEQIGLHTKCVCHRAREPWLRSEFYARPAQKAKQRRAKRLDRANARRKKKNGRLIDRRISPRADKVLVIAAKEISGRGEYESHASHTLEPTGTHDCDESCW